MKLRYISDNLLTDSRVIVDERKAKARYCSDRGLGQIRMIEGTCVSMRYC